jgi:hypothetical protein
MKPRVPIERWVPPPDPVDGLLDGAVRPPRVVPASNERESEPRLSAPTIVAPTPIRPDDDDRRAKAAVDQLTPARVHVTLYLEPEDMDRLRSEQLRRQQELRRPKRGVTDASAVVRDLIRKHLR